MVIKHIHKYRRKKLGKSYIYKCEIAGCTHFIQMSLAEGRACICSRCGNPFTITRTTIKNCPAHPHCEDCYKTSNVEKNRDKAIDDILETLIPD